MQSASLDGLPLIACDLEVDSQQLDHLGLFDRRPPSSGTTAYRDEKQQLLTAGTSMGAKLQGRLKMAKFGHHKGGDHACIVVMELNFKPKRYTGVLRFREATVEVQVNPGKGDDAETQAEIARAEQEKEEECRPTIADWYPRYVEGPVKTTLEEFNISVEGDAIPLAGGASFGPSVGYSVSRERESRRRIHGTLEGDTASVVEWRLEENNSSGDGIPPRCDFALLVRWRRGRTFHLRMRVRAITLAGLPVVGRDVQAVYFTSDLAGPGYAGPTTTPLSPCITGGGVVGSGQDVYASPDRGQDDGSGGDLTGVALSGLTDVVEQLAETESTG